jgi:hypothetical protein
MPRKPSLGPPVLRIEDLSTGLDTSLRDDFTGAVLVQAQAEPRRGTQEIINERDAAKHAENQLLLQAAGIIPKPHVPACVRPNATAEPAGTRRDGQRPKRPMRPMRLTLVRQPKEWRRI